MMAGVKLLLRRNWEILNSEESSEKARVSASHIILSCYEKLSEQLKDKFAIMDGLVEEESPKLSLEEQAYREAQGRDYRRRQAVF